MLKYGTSVKVWLALVLLTGLTLSLAGRPWGPLNMLMVLAIATFKSGLVASYFMHLNYEKGLGWLKGMILGVILLLAILIGLTFFDIAYR